VIDRPVDTERIGEEEQTQQTTGAFYSRILGAVIGANGIIKPSWAIIFIILALVISLVVLVKRRN